jgi:hypothetical protein
MPTDSTFSASYEEELNLDFKTSRSTGLLFYAGMNLEFFVVVTF